MADENDLEPLVGRDPGQPKRTSLLVARVTPGFFDAVTEAATARGMTRADAIRDWIKDGMDRDKTRRTNDDHTDEQHQPNGGPESPARHGPR